MSAAATVTAPPELLSAAERIAKTMIEGGGAAWSTMTGADLAYRPGESRYDRPEALAAALGPTLVTRIDWSGDRAGTVYLLLGAESGKAIVAHMMALMMGGDADVAGTALDTEGMDAYTEAAGNFIGQGAQALRGELGGNLKFTAAGTKLADGPAQIVEGMDAKPLAALFGDFHLGADGPYTLAVWMSPSCTGVAAPDAAGAAGDDSESSRLLAEYAPENVAHAMKLPVPLVVVLAEKKMRMELVQEMAPGTIIEFRKRSEENLDVCANNVKIADAQVVTTNKHFGVRLSRMVDPKAKNRNA